MPCTQKSNSSAANAKHPVRLKITSHPATLAQVREAIETICLAHGFDATSVGEIGLCVNEALANVMRHAYDGATDKPIIVDAAFENDAICITIRDWGNGVNPIELADRPHDPNQPGGLGLICLTKLMDSAVFAPQGDGMLLTMSRGKSRANQV